VTINPVEQKLIDAVRWGNRVALAHAIGEGASVLLKDEHGNDIILVAGRLDHWDIVSILLHCKANVEAESVRGGNRLIHLAAAGGHWAAVCELIRFKASLNAVNKFGDTALDIAIRNNHRRVIELLYQNGGRAQSEMYHVGEIAHKVAADYTTQHFGEPYACLCNHGLSFHTDGGGRCDAVTRRRNGDEELCACDSFADVWGREVPANQFKYRISFGDHDLESF
jgi:ankyrin repeat protein